VYLEYCTAGWRQLSQFDLGILSRAMQRKSQAAAERGDAPVRISHPASDGAAAARLLPTPV